MMPILHGIFSFEKEYFCRSSFSSGSYRLIKDNLRDRGESFANFVTEDGLGYIWRECKLVLHLTTIVARVIAFIQAVCGWYNRPERICKVFDNRL